MRYCPTCASAYPNRSSGTCPKDGSVLVTQAQFEQMQNDPLMGVLLGGRYRVVGRVGTGGMGTVYRAEQQGLGRPVALKVLKAELVSDRETVGRFQREAKAMSLLVHPNTVRVFDFGEDPAGHLFLAMELLVGELLTTKLDREGTLDVREAIGVTQQILRSLHEAHTKGLVHRDLKPDNIYLAHIEGHPDAVVKVLDFGIAKIFRDDQKPIDQLETQAGTVFGTPRYMSPEQAQGKALDPRSDLYSVGVLLYQLLVGHAPFVDEDAVVVMAKHIREEVVPVRQAAPGRPIPATLEGVLARALEKEPSRRFISAEAFDQALAACLPDVDRERALRASGRSTAHAHPSSRYVPHAIGAALLVLAAAVAGLVVWKRRTATPELVIESIPSTTPPPSTTPAALGVPTTPPTTVVATRRILVESAPAGARVWRGGSDLGPAPITFDVTPGTAGTVELRLEGYATAVVDLETASDHVVAELVTDAAQRRPRVRHDEAAPPATPTTMEALADTSMTPPASSSTSPYERWE